MGQPLKIVEETIDGEQYKMFYLPARVARSILLQTIKMVLPAIANAVDSVKGAGSVDAEMDVEAMIEMLLDSEISIEKIAQLLCQSADIDAINHIMDTVFTQTVHVGKGKVSDVFDELFTGRPLHMMKVFTKALGVQFGDFFAGKSVNGSIKAMTDLTH